MMDAETKSNILARLKRVQGQVGALCRMVDEDHDCVDLLLQIAAAQGALGKAGEIVLGAHIQTCVSEAFAHGSSAERTRRIEELMQVFGRYGRIGAR